MSGRKQYRLEIIITETSDETWEEINKPSFRTQGEKVVDMVMEALGYHGIPFDEDSEDDGVSLVEVKEVE